MCNSTNLIIIYFNRKEHDAHLKFKKVQFLRDFIHAKMKKKK